MRIKVSAALADPESEENWDFTEKLMTTSRPKSILTLMTEKDWESIEKRWATGLSYRRGWISEW